MDGVQTESNEERKAFGISLILHLLLFLIAAELGLFSAAEPSGKAPPIDVVLYDAGGDGAGTVGDAAPPAAPVVTVDDIVVQDKKAVYEEPQEQQVVSQTSPVRTVRNTARAAQTGSAGNSGHQSGSASGSSSAGMGRRSRSLSQQTALSSPSVSSPHRGIARWTEPQSLQAGGFSLIRGTMVGGAFGKRRSAFS